MPLVRRWREIRIANGLTVAEAAERLGITRDALFKIERGDSFVIESTLEKACRLYDCQPGDLFESKPGYRQGVRPVRTKKVQV